MRERLARSMLESVVIAIIGLVAFAIAFDVVGRRRGRYRSPAEWLAISRRRKEHFRTAREARRSAAGEGADGPHRR